LKPAILCAPGEVLTVEFPFVIEMRDDYQPVEGTEDREGVPEYRQVQVPSWKPGIRFRYHGPEDMNAVADGIGAMELTVVSVHKPGTFPTRVFYLRAFIDPAGRRFGKTKQLRVTSLGHFRRMATSYQRPFSIASEAA
jgi:hypothetical protein